VNVAGAEAGGDVESTVVDVTGERPQVLRWGSLPASEVQPMLRQIGPA
jgi:tRNA A37 threonylcarbamoyladenosine synthetase subunit TsaC/SUA5/YrdC